MSITASCAAPNCNVGVQPVQPVYSSTTPSNGVYVGNPITGLITGSPVTTGNVYVTTTQCDTAAGSPINGCQPLLVTIASQDQHRQLQHHPSQFSKLAGIFSYRKQRLSRKFGRPDGPGSGGRGR